MRLMTLLTFLIAMVGCATTNDPKQGGFFSGVNALSTGAYERRLDSKKERLNATSYQHNQLRGDANTISNEYTDVTSKLKNAEARLVTLDNGIDDLKLSLHKYQIEQKFDEETYRRLKSEVADLKLELSLVSSDPTLSAQSKQEQISILEDRKTKIEQDIEAAALSM